MKSLHDYRGEHRAALKRYHRAYNRAHASRAAYNKLMELSVAVNDAYVRRFNAEVAYREGK